jgi:branched-chain amino acid aminotransferase
MSHVVNYGSCVFEGVRCYTLLQGPAIFRAREHIERLFDSAQIYRIGVPFTRQDVLDGMAKLVGQNGILSYKRQLDIA